MASWSRLLAVRDWGWQKFYNVSPTVSLYAKGMRGTDFFLNRISYIFMKLHLNALLYQISNYRNLINKMTLL